MSKITTNSNMNDLKAMTKSVNEKNFRGLKVKENLERLK